mmetsp:Transcript_11850/g.22570  ORF Transcript_11850/g.22570 Transcript_11850/m.22570 type:complete len:271 (-) Transcript_11850:80-892(-)
MRTEPLWARCMSRISPHKSNTRDEHYGPENRTSGGTNIGSMPQHFHTCYFLPAKGGTPIETTFTCNERETMLGLFRGLFTFRRFLFDHVQTPTSILNHGLHFEFRIQRCRRGHRFILLPKILFSVHLSFCAFELLVCSDNGGEQAAGFQKKKSFQTPGRWQTATLCIASSCPEAWVGTADMRLVGTAPAAVAAAPRTPPQPGWGTLPPWSWGTPANWQLQARRPTAARRARSSQRTEREHRAMHIREILCAYFFAYISWKIWHPMMDVRA